MVDMVDMVDKVGSPWQNYPYSLPRLAWRCSSLGHGLLGSSWLVAMQPLPMAW